MPTRRASVVLTRLSMLKNALPPRRPSPAEVEDLSSEIRVVVPLARLDAVARLVEP